MIKNNKKHFWKDRNKGAAMITAVILFLFISMVVTVGISTPILKQANISKNITVSKNSYYLASASLEDVFYRLKNNRQVSSTESLSLNGGTVNAVISNTSTGKEVISTGNTNNAIRKVKMSLVFGTGIAFHYGVQAGQGGFSLQNSSSITGNVYSDGPIVGSGNYIYGDVVSSGPSGLIDGIHATGTAWAHTITNSIIDKDAYYTNRTNTTVAGNSYPNSPDLDTVPLPISDDQIDIWKSDAEFGGEVTCSSGKYSVTSNITIGPKKIPCNLEIQGTAVVTLTGPIWVTGDITIKNSSIIKISSTLGSQSVVMIADNPSNRTTGSKISVENSATFQNSGTSGSFIFLISQNNSAELGGNEQAISMGNSSSGALVLYAGHGLIELENNISLREVTAWKITLKNSANVIYDTGLPSSLFQSGPGGGYDLVEWLEVQ